jgi:DNA-binding NtrC family response regulator
VALRLHQLHCVDRNIFSPCFTQEYVFMHDRAKSDASLVVGETILLVEDEAVVREITAEVLKRAGYQVPQAEGAASAILIAEAHQGKIDLLLTDVVMPGMNGADLGRRLQELHPDLTIAFMSGYAQHDIMRKIMLEATTVYIPKPFTLDVLLAGVSNAIRFRSGATKVGDSAPVQ